MVKNPNRKNGVAKNASRESKRDEHSRLQRRTDELRRNHAALSRERVPFNKADHDPHTENLRQHRADLAEHKDRADDVTEVPADNAPGTLDRLTAASRRVRAAPKGTAPQRRASKAR